MSSTVTTILAIVVLSGVSLSAGAKDCSLFTPDPVLIKSDRKTLIEEENQKLSSVTEKNLNGVVLVRLFKGYFPLPSRYVLMAGIAHDGQHERYASPPLLSGNKELLQKSFENLNGNVSVGKYKDYLKEMKRANSEGPPSTQRTIFECVADNLKVELKRSTEFSDVLRIVIHTETEYIDLIDENPYLWKHLIDIYLTTIRKET